MSRRHVGRSVAAVVCAALLAGCGAADGSGSTDAPRTATTPPTPDGESRTSAPAEDQQPREQEQSMQIEITIGDQRFAATLDDSEAGRDLLAQLPQTIEMRDHGGVEKTGRLQASLSLDGQPSGADPDVGALGYYAPGQDLVLYHGDQSYFEGIVVLGRLEGDAATRIARIDGDVTVTVDAVR